MTEPTASKRVETHSIEWGCGNCLVRARLPQLAGATINDVRDAIVRGHERRSFDCHMAHGIKHVRAIQDGKTLRFTGAGGGAQNNPDGNNLSGSSA